VALGALATLGATALPHSSFAFHSPSLDTAIETAIALISLLAAYLVWGRFRQTARVDDLAITFALAYIAAASVLFRIGPTALPNAVGDRFAVWAPLVGRFSGAACLAVAASMPSRPVRRVARVPLLAALGVTLLIATAIAIHFAAQHLPTTLDAAPAPAMSLLHLIGAVFLVAAAVAFARRGLRDDDELMRWLAAGAVLGAFARLNFAIAPAALPGWVYAVDVLRVACYLFVLIGGAREIDRYQRSSAETAALEERQRLARDLHDGLAQELAYIAMAVKNLRRGPASSAELEELVSASDRALLESREAIETLGRDEDRTLAETLASAANDVAKRAGALVELAVAPEVDVSDEARGALTKIVREAAANAVRHGGATRIAIDLRQEEGVLLRISDNGHGIKLRSTNGSASDGGYGLKSMRRRAELLGGTLRVVSSGGHGTEVEVELP
jgi:signal transduction histidine kinase